MGFSDPFHAKVGNNFIQHSLHGLFCTYSLYFLKPLAEKCLQLWEESKYPDSTKLTSCDMNKFDLDSELVM